MKAAFSEMLRLHDAGGCAREVENNTVLTVNHKQYLLEKGSFVLWLLDCVHKDPEIHRDPDEFQVDRFLYLYSDSKSTKRYEKRGVPLQRVLVPFGGGVYQVTKITIMHADPHSVRDEGLQKALSSCLRPQYSTN
jgi:cytochrome P450